MEKPEKCPVCGRPVSWIEEREVGGNVYYYAVHYLGKDPATGKRRVEKCYLGPKQYVYRKSKPLVEYTEAKDVASVVEYVKKLLAQLGEEERRQAAAAIFDVIRPYLPPPPPPPPSPPPPPRPTPVQALPSDVVSEVVERVKRVKTPVAKAMALCNAVCAGKPEPEFSECKKRCMERAKECVKAVEAGDTSCIQQLLM